MRVLASMYFSAESMALSTTAAQMIEKRTPREKFTSILRRMCERLDAQKPFELRDKGRYAKLALSAGIRTEADLCEEVEITDLWVVGSYARGALTCGDLDVVISTRRLNGEHRRVHYSQLVRPAFGTIAHLRCYEGTWEKNSSGVAFPEAVHLWTKGKDWGSALTSIRPDPAAVRFARKEDAIPLRAEQYDVSEESLKDMLDRYEKGEITWRFVPFEGKAVLENLSELEEHLLQRRLWGKKTQALIPHMLRYLRSLNLKPGKTDNWHRSVIELAGTRFALGKPVPDISDLDTDRRSRVCLIPHFSRRGPNGIWEIRRGANHPLELRFAKLEAFTFERDGILDFIQVFPQKWWGPFDHATVVEMFSSEAEAAVNLEQMLERDEFMQELARVRRLQGSELLDVIAQVDAVELLGESPEVFTLTTEGARVLEAQFSAQGFDRLADRIERRQGRSSRPHP
jgi:DNA polymerase beta catalytic subunit